jgi:hypothetical protein
MSIQLAVLESCWKRESIRRVSNNPVLAISFNLEFNMTSVTAILLSPVFAKPDSGEVKTESFRCPLTSGFSLRSVYAAEPVPCGVRGPAEAQ